jgi:Flp pilus assembly protein TadB
MNPTLHFPVSSWAKALVLLFAFLSFQPIADAGISPKPSSSTQPQQVEPAKDAPSVEQAKTKKFKKVHKTKKELKTKRKPGALALLFWLVVLGLASALAFIIGHFVAFPFWAMLSLGIFGGIVVLGFLLVMLLLKSLINGFSKNIGKERPQPSDKPKKST